MTDNDTLDNEELADANYSEVTDSVAFSLVDDLLRTKKITNGEAEFMRDRYRKLYDIVMTCRNRDAGLSKKIRGLTNDILAEKIAFEKVKAEENEQMKNLRKLEQDRDAVQKDLDFTSQRDVMAKFELAEFKKVHEELNESLARMRKENSDLVEPVLNGLKEQIATLNEQLQESEDMEEREVNHKKSLLEKVKELEKQKEQLAEEKASLLSDLEKARTEPDRLSRQAESIEKAANVFEAELKNTQRKIKQSDNELEKQAKKIKESERLKLNLIEKLEFHRQTLVQRENDCAVIRKQLENEKATHHDLVTTKFDLGLKSKEADSDLRHKNDQINFIRKEYDSLKRQYKKKRGIADQVRAIIPQLEEQTVNQEHVMRSYKEESDACKKKISSQKDEVDIAVAQLLQQENIEKNQAEILEKTIKEVDELEADVVRWMAEEKRQGKLIAVLSAQRDIKARESARVEQKQKDARQHVRMKELIILDLTKRCNELSNRLKEFSALYEVVKNERNKYVNLIQSSAQALAEMREKIRILHNEAEILRNESTAKDKALAKERTSHQNAQSQRDALRQEMNKLLAEYRQKQSVVEQQIQEIDKLNLVINNLEKEMLDLKSRYERAVEERNVTGVQLIDRNDELCILYERSNQQQEALKKGEIQLRKKEEEVRMTKLQLDELMRQYHAATKRVPEIGKCQARIAELEEMLVQERQQTDAMSAKLEDPGNTDRWRALDGEDATIEQLISKSRVLEERLDVKREQLLEKELILEEVTSLTERLRNQAVSRRDNSKKLADELNSLQSRIRDTTKKMLASVSELSMYQATALRLQQEKVAREKVLEESKWRVERGEAPSEDAIKEFNRDERRRLHAADTAMRREEELQMSSTMGALKSSAEPRPTAYIPDDIGIPKPYGNSAPFKPTEMGSTMRHIRQPNPKPIEI
mmetsp:Transcript_15813/g.23794  ORF Transcript_15813/g.23794 Transcript_15813/m.23794 type:complete len:931 (-) Transcript_15813:142-2934(-)|eukprot:CAMPEP_0185023550 /NCGR_PEP_ID=MMETSP1103-20130426/6207_1 /TAXON_ID=36769 /ORGANISM="Paraphysomonas bandaiensis, Strain Caron Lab Isolate" /LENGTH=930 /DNA_ID=CAMNT_0027556187 /DNA_START=178 /DNA_END=2970 /DNA_ORIENTATION=+